MAKIVIKKDVICKSPGEYGYWAPDTGAEGTGGDTWEQYKDGIWLAPELLGSYTDTYGFEFEVRWDITPPPTTDNTSPGYTTKFKSASITGIPDISIQVTKGDNFINLKSSRPQTIDTVEPMASYISHRLILSGDMYYNISTHTPITKAQFKEQIMHYTGKSWIYKGLNAYTKDGFTFCIAFTVTVEYIKEYSSSLKEPENIITSKTFKIQVNPNYSYTEFKKRYAQYCEPEETAFRDSL